MIVLLPGLDGTGALFKRLITCLPRPETVRVVIYPGDVQLTYEELEAYVVEEIPAGEPVTVLAESFSGPIALKLAARPNVNVTAAVLVCSFAARPLGWLGFLIAGLPLQLVLRMPLPESIIRRFLVGSNASDELISQTRAAVSKVGPKVLAFRLRMALTSTYCTGPLQCKARVIALVSERDRLVGRTAVQSIRRACSGAEVYDIDSPHFALQAAPESVLKALSKLGVVLG